MRSDEPTHADGRAAGLLAALGHWLGWMLPYPLTGLGCPPALPRAAGPPPPRTLIGVGISRAEADRFGRVLHRTPELSGRLFTHAERELALTPDAHPDTRSLASYFAAKTAVAAALGAPGGLRWHDAEVRRGPDGRPVLRVRRSVAAAARRHGVRSWHLTLSLEGPEISAMVIATS